MKKKEIACVLPTNELADIILSVSKDLDIPIEIIVSNDLNTILSTTKRLADEGTQVIISRGIAAWNIGLCESSLAVIDIPVTGFDLLNSLKGALNIGHPIGICEVAPIIRTVEAMEDYTGIRLVKHVINDYKEIEKGIEHLYQQGVCTIIGRIIATNIANKFGMRAVIIDSGREAVTQAMEEAQRMVQAKKAERARSEQFRTIIDFAYEGIVAVNASGIITSFNPAAERILGLKKQYALGKPALVIPNTGFPKVLKSGQPTLEAIQDVKGTKIITNRIPIIIDGKILGAVATFQEVSYIQHMEQSARRKLASRGHVARYYFTNLLGQSYAINSCITRARRFAAVDSTILILGETGTGKELFAHAIHNESKRHDKPFVAVNCAALPENLLESELFGYVEGAFTGARKEGKPGLFELAHGGTIFLDEIPEMSHRLQSKLLRVLEQHEVTRLGDDKVIPINVRVIAASNQNISLLVEKRDFRQDLYHRLNVLRLELPPLRERREDIPIMATSFLTEISIRHHGHRCAFTQEAIKLLCSQAWPGNIRELKNTIERVAVVCQNDIITDKDLGSCLETSASSILANNENSREDFSPVHNWEREAILSAMEQVQGNKSKAASILGIGRSTLWRKLKSMDTTKKT